MPILGIDADTLASWRTSGLGFLQRQAKHVGQARHGWAHPRQVSFVFGCQRSGTKMVMRVLDESGATRIYHENHRTAFRDFQLREDPVLRALVASSPAPAQIFKPICDSQEADEILERFPSARGLWIFRDPDDVANSAVRKWGSHQLELVDAAVRGETERWGWRLARLDEAALADLARVHRQDLSPHEGALLFWWLRNRFVYQLGLDQHPRLRVVRYERLVSEPEAAFPAVFAQVGAPWDPEAVARVRTSSVSRRPPPPAHPDIRALVDGLHERLLATAAVHAEAPPPLPSPVLMIIDTLGVGGAERYVVSAANWLAEQGARVVVTAAPGGALEGDLDPRVHFEAADIDSVRAGLPRAARHVRRLVTEHEPAVVVAHSLATTLMTRAALPSYAVPVVQVAHGWAEDRFRHVAPMMRAADRVVAVSRDVRDKLLAAGLDEGRCVVVENGVDTRELGRRTGPERTALRAECGASEDELLVLVVGRLEAQKAHQHVVSVAQLLRERAPRLRFAVAGAGSREAELRQLVAEAGLDERVRFLGLRRDVPALLGVADLFLNCSDWEGMPLTTIEAMATGLPVVATETEGASRLLTGGAGLVVPVGDAQAIAAALEQLAADPERRGAMGTLARERAEAQYGQDRLMGELVDVMREVRSAPAP